MKENHVKFEWTRGEDELLIVDQYAYLGVDISQACSWGAHTANVIGKGKTHFGKVDAFLTDSRLDTKIKRGILVVATVPYIEYTRQVWEHKVRKNPETGQMTVAAKK